MRRVGQHSEDRFSAAGHAAVRLDEMDGFAEGLLGDLGEAGRRFLVGNELRAIPERLPPAGDPLAAESAVAVEDDDRALGRAHRDVAIIPFRRATRRTP